MSNITKIYPVCETLSPIESQAVLANRQPKIKEIASVNLVDPIEKALSKAIVVMGSTAKIDFKAMHTEIISELKNNFTVFSVEEVCIAIDMGSKGKLGDDFVHVHTRAVLKWIWLYADLVRREALHKQSKSEEKIEKEITQKQRLEKIESFNNEILQVYNSYCENFEMPELSTGLKATYCRHLYSKNIVELSAEQEAEIFAKAKKEVPAEEISLIPLNDVDRIFNNKKKSAQIQEIAESIALEYLFTEYLKSSINLQEKLNE